MTAKRIAGIIALVSGSLLVLGIVASAFVGPAALLGNGTTPAAGSTGWWSGWPMGPWMMGSGWNGAPGAAGPGPGVTGRGPGMMGFGWSGSEPSGSSSVATPAPNTTDVRVQASNFSFTPDAIQLPKGTDVNLTLVNPTSLPHDLTVPGLGIHLVANAGETRTVALHDLAAGTYDAFCSVPGHAQAGMRATVVVR